MNDAMVRLTVTDTINGQLCIVSMPYPRECWYDVDDYDREQLRLIARHRFCKWAREEAGVELPEKHVDALPVTAA